MLLRFAYLEVSNKFAVLRLLPMSDREKDAEILALRHQIRILQRQLDGQRVRFVPSDRALLAALLGALPRRTNAAGAIPGSSQTRSRSGRAWVAILDKE